MTAPAASASNRLFLLMLNVFVGERVFTPVDEAPSRWGRGFLWSAEQTITRGREIAGLGVSIAKEVTQSSMQQRARCSRFAGQTLHERWILDSTVPVPSIFVSFPHAPVRGAGQPLANAWHC